MKIYPNRKKVILFFLFTIVFALTNVGFQYINQILFNIIYLRVDEAWRMLNNVIFWEIVFALIFGISMYLKDYYNKQILKDINIKLKDQLFDKIFSLNINEFVEGKNNDFISLINNDVSLLEENYFQARNDMVYQAVQLILAVVFLFYINPILAVIILVISMIPILIPKVFAKKIDAQTKEMSDNIEEYTNTIKEDIIGAETIKTFGKVDNILSTFYRRVDDMEESNLKRNKTYYIMYGIVASSSYIIFFVTLIVGLILIAMEKTTIGTVIAASNTSNLVRNPIKGIANNLNSMNSVKAIVEKINHLLNINTQIENEVEYHDFKDRIEIKNVSFKYNDRYVLSNINLKFQKGKRYLIVGESGCGKSTLLRLLLGGYRNFEGDIQVDGYDLKSLSETSIGNIFSYIHQTAFIFNDSILNNITLFKPYKHGDLNRAILISKVDEIIDKKSDGIQTIISEGGFSLSGGEKQRIQIARALVFQRPVMLLDEVTSALDNNMSIEIGDELLNLKDMTLINISHKINKKELFKYDEIICMKDGQVKVNGNYEQIKDDTYFKQLLKIGEENDENEVNN